MTIINTESGVKYRQNSVKKTDFECRRSRSLSFIRRTKHGEVEVGHHDGAMSNRVCC